MKVMKGGGRVILYECVGFGLILLLSALNNLLGLPQLLVGGEGVVSRWRYGVMETVVILLIWAFVFSITRRLMQRVHHLEGMLRVCGWCRRIGHGNKWMLLEDYFAEGLQIGTTHSICPECRRKIDEDTRQFRQSRTQAFTPNREAQDQPSDGT